LDREAWEALLSAVAPDQRSYAWLVTGNTVPGSQSHYASALYSVATTYTELDDDSTALQYLSEALPIFRKTGNPRGQAYVLKAFGDV
jgi:hypothetical protein